MIKTVVNEAGWDETKKWRLSKRIKADCSKRIEKHFKILSTNVSRCVISDEAWGIYVCMHGCVHPLPSEAFFPHFIDPVNDSNYYFVYDQGGQVYERRESSSLRQQSLSDNEGGTAGQVFRGNTPNTWRVLREKIIWANFERSIVHS